VAEIGGCWALTVQSALYSVLGHDNAGKVREARKATGKATHLIYSWQGFNIDMKV